MTTPKWALRTLRRNPAFALAVITTLSLGIGSAVLVFTVLHSVVLRPLPFANPQQLVFIWIDDAKRAVHEKGLSYSTFLDWKAQSRTFQDIAVRGRGFSTTLAGSEPERILIDVASANYFALLGIRPIEGRVFGRLKSGVTPQAAEAELDSIGAQLAKAYPVNDPEFGGYGTHVVSFDEQILGLRLPRILWIMMGAVGLVLLVACVNIANLLLARGTLRQSEIAVRAALGAGKGSLIRQQMVEGGFLALLGGAGGLALSWLGLRLLPLIAPRNLPRFDTVDIDPSVLLFAIVASLFACILFSVIPAWIQARRDPTGALRGATVRVTDGGASKLQSCFVIAEFALSLALLTAAGLFLRSFLAVVSTPAGFETNGTLLFQIDRDFLEPSEKRAAFYRSLLDGLRGLPGVTATGAITDFFIEKNPDYIVTVQGKPTESHEQITVDTVSPGFLEAVGARFLRGRFLAASDYSTRPTAIVINETFARRLFPGEQALGRYLKFGTADAGRPWIQVVGVVADLHRQGLEKHAVCEAFAPMFNSSMDVIVHASVPSQTLLAAVRAKVREIDPTLPVYGVTTLENRLNDFAADRRLQVWLLSGFSVLTLLLGAVGIYSVSQYLVSQRRHELAIRVALGADAANIQRMIVRRGAFQAVAGMGLGLLITLAASRVITTLLYGVGPLDPITLTIACTVLLCVGIAGCWLPAHSAAKTNPTTLMKT